MILKSNERMMKEIAAVLANPMGKMTDAQKRAALAKALQSKEAMAAYAMQRVPIINLYVKAQIIGTKFFTVQTLTGAEIPMYISQGALPRIPINVISDWGGLANYLYTNSQGYVTFDLGYIATDKVKTPKISLVQGRIDKSEEVNGQIAYMMSDKLDDMAWDAVGTCFGDFDDTVFILDKKIQNPPTTNDLDFGDTCKGKLTKDFYRGIVDHFARLGLTIQNVIVPSIRIPDHMDWVAVTGTDNKASDTVPVDVASKIWQSGGLNLGANWIPNIEGTNVLKGEGAGPIYCYALAADPKNSLIGDGIGIMYEKPEIDIVKTDDTDPLFYETYQTKAVAFAVPAPNRKNILRIRIDQHA